MAALPPRRSPALLSLVLSALLFVVSLLLPAFHSGGDGAPNETTTGLTALGIGWFPALFGLIELVQGGFEYFGTLAWFANPLLLASAIFIGKGQRSRGIATASLALLTASIFLGCRAIPVPDNHTLTPIAPGTGYFLWIASMVVALAGAMGTTSAASTRTPS